MVLNFEISGRFNKCLVTFVDKWTPEADFFFDNAEGASDGFCVFDDIGGSLLWFGDGTGISDEVFELLSRYFVEESFINFGERDFLLVE